MRVLKWFKTTSTPTKPDAHTSPRCRHLCDISTGAKAVQTACGNAPPDRAWRSLAASPAIKRPFPPTFVSRPLSFLLYPSTHQTALPPSSPPCSLAPAGPGWPRFRAPHSPAAVPPPSPFNHLFVSAWPTTYRSLVLSSDHPSARCRVGGRQLTVTTMACLNPSSRRPVYRRDSPRDVAVRLYSEWQQSKVVNETLKTEFQKACDIALNDGLDLEQVYED
jgi:hypothetical protein